MRGTRVDIAKAVEGHDLGRRLGAGDEAALAQCYTELGALVRRYARRHVSLDDVDDVVQLVFIEVWRCRERYDPERSLEAWVLRIARNRAIDHQRARWRHDHRAVPLDAADTRSATGPDGRSDTERSDRAHDVRHALAALPSSQRAAIELAYFGDLSQREIAERTGTPIGTIKARTARGLRRLGTLLAA